MVLLEILLDSSLLVAHGDEPGVLQLHDLLHDGRVLQMLLHGLQHRVSLANKRSQKHGESAQWLEFRSINWPPLVPPWNRAKPGGR